MGVRQGARINVNGDSVPMNLKICTDQGVRSAIHNEDTWIVVKDYIPASHMPPSLYSTCKLKGG